MNHKFNYKWTLKDATFTKDKGTVFSCFAGGGGSSMGYKLAGFDVIGCNEIDHRMMYAYCQNNGNPKFRYLEAIQDFVKEKEMPPELYELDILDGSPPCSSFSLASVGGECGRQNGWGKKKKFREGQSEQVLDTLFFDFIELAGRLHPKVVVAENVRGLLLGEAKGYVSRICREFDKAGYHVQHWLLDAQYMGVPQRRERVFFIALRKDLVQFVPCQRTLFDAIPVLDMKFNETPITFGECYDGKGNELVGEVMRKTWEQRQPGDSDLGDITKRMSGKERMFNFYLIGKNEVCRQLTGKECTNILFDEPRYLSEGEECCVATFPQDYDFAGNKPHYVCGMSVPPVMMAQVASRIYEQWLSKIKV